MRRVSFVAAVVLFALVSASPSLAAPADNGPTGAALQAAREARSQELSAHMMRLQGQIQQLNQRLVPMPLHQGFKDLGVSLGIACERLRDADRHLQQLRDDATFAARPDGDPTIDRLGDRLRVIDRELEEGNATLQSLVVMPVRPGSPVDAAEQMNRAQRQQELEQVQQRTDERLKALDAWSKGAQVVTPAKDLVRDAIQMRDRMRLLALTCVKLTDDPQIELDRDRVREIDRVRDRVQVMLREIEEMADTLERGVTA